ncbi:MAG: hypothetical protein IJJ79_07160 [Lachnospiraceae bacterium]|nr:hypothetical protein [Lachnospiraceae bacterium]
MRKIIVFKKLKKDNKGAGFFTVIVAVLFLMVISVALIYSSFTAYKVKISSKRSNSAFYYADMAIEEIKTGFQKVVSDSARAGYENVLSRYTSSVSQTLVFKEAYAKSFRQFQYKDADTGLESPLFMTNGIKITGVYSKGIKSFLSDEIKNDKLSITSLIDPSNTTFLPCTQDDKGNVTIKGLKAEYTDGEYTSYITTDIKLLIPDVTLTGSYDVGGLESYLFIADGGFDAGNEGAITTTTLKSGTNAFFGELKLDNNRGFVCEDNCTVVVGKLDRDAFEGVGSLQTSGEITIADPTTLTLGKNCTLYATDITLSENGTLIEGENCKTYVADDLSLAGESKATIAGTYIGFGNGSNSDGSANFNNAADSSSVLFPKRTVGTNKAELDLKNCNSFTLAGKSYITNSLDTAGYSDVGMGSSISSTKEQLIYLVPADYLGGGTNPTLINGTRAEVVTQTTEKKQMIVDNLSRRPLFTLRTGDVKYANNYGITSSDNIKTLIYPVVGADQQWAVYYFFDFGSSLENSNNYFKDFFNSGSNKIMSYLNDYAKISGDAAKIFTAGTGAITQDNGEITITEATQRDLDGISNELSQVYKNLCQTMNPQGAAEGKSPFLTLVDVKHLHEVIDAAVNNLDNAKATYADGYQIQSVHANSEKKTGASGNYVRIKANTASNKAEFDIAVGDYYQAGSGNDFHLVICDGDVHLTNEWRGLIICSGKIYNDGCSAAQLDSNSSMEDKGASIFTNSKFYTGNAITPNNDNWDMDDQVIFENWKKNEG